MFCIEKIYAYVIYALKQVLQFKMLCVNKLCVYQASTVIIKCSYAQTCHVYSKYCGSFIYVSVQRNKFKNVSCVYFILPYYPKKCVP
jgi:hypothetical protein